MMRSVAGSCAIAGTASAVASAAAERMDRMLFGLLYGETGTGLRSTDGKTDSRARTHESGGPKCHRSLRTYERDQVQGLADIRLSAPSGHPCGLTRLGDKGVRATASRQGQSVSAFLAVGILGALRKALPLVDRQRLVIFGRRR